MFLPILVGLEPSRAPTQMAPLIIPKIYVYISYYYNKISTWFGIKSFTLCSMIQYNLENISVVGGDAADMMWVDATTCRSTK